MWNLIDSDICSGRYTTKYLQAGRNRLSANLCMCKWMQAVAELLLIVKQVFLHSLWQFSCGMFGMWWYVKYPHCAFLYIERLYSIYKVQSFFFPSNVISRIGSWFVTLLLSHHYAIARLKLSNMCCIVPQLEWMILPLIYYCSAQLLHSEPKEYVCERNITLTFSKFQFLLKTICWPTCLSSLCYCLEVLNECFGLPGRYLICWGQTFGGGDGWLPICRPWTLLLCVA